MSKKKSVKLTPKGRPSLQREAKPDDPIYKRGFIVGGYVGGRGPLRKPSSEPSKKGTDKSEK